MGGMDAGGNKVKQVAAEYELSVEEKILLICARTHLDEEQDEYLKEILKETVDWKTVVGKTVPHRMSGLAFYHLKPFLESINETDALETLRRLALSETAGYLRIGSVQKVLNEKVLAELDVPHVFIKGIGLAEQLYPNPSVRISRDIDVWVEPSAMAEVWKRLDSLGYTRLEKPDDSHMIPAHHAAYLLPTIDVIGSDGVLVEIHMRYDHSGLTINAAEMYARSEKIDTPIGSIRIPRFEDHFAYVCQHHTRHLWARLRWFADLDAFQRSPSFDEAAVLKRARDMSLNTTVEACLQLSQHLSRPADIERACHNPQAEELKKWILRCLESGPGAAHEAQVQRSSEDFALSWQYGWRHLAKTYLSKIRPTQADYLARPRDMQDWWKYYLTRPFRLLRSSAARD